jgi:hypothetical protein
VPRSRVLEFEAAYASVKDPPKPLGWKRSKLLRDTKEEGIYRVSTLWENRQALEEVRESTGVPVAIALFRKIGVEPNLESSRSR